MTLVRPEFLLLILPGLLLLRWRRKATQDAHGWSGLLPAAFIAALRVDTRSGRPAGLSARSHLKAHGWQRIAQQLDHWVDRGWSWSCVILLPVALAGPSLPGTEVEVQERSDALVLVLDLSLSMLATDLEPNRLTRARLKLRDLLAERKEGSTGLIGYAGSAHVVAPLTDDHTTLRALLPALDPLIMPEFGSDLPAALNLAGDLLTQAGFSAEEATQTRILVLTDGIDPADQSRLQQWRGSSPWPLSILAVGTDAGGPIPVPSQGFLRSQGEVVLPQLDFDTLQKLVRSEDDRISRLRVDERDLEEVLPRFRFDASAERRLERLSRPQEIGFYLLIPLLCLGLWQWRGRTAPLLCLGLMPGAVLLGPPPAHAIEMESLLLNADRQAHELFLQGDPEAAAALFRDRRWQAAAHYQSGDYDAALAALEGLDDADAHYNRGNAQARLGEFDAAIQSYSKALEQDPDYEAARANRQKLLDLLQDQAQSQSGQSANESQSEDSQAQNSEDGQTDPDSEEASEGQSGESSGESQRENGQNGSPENGSEKGGAQNDEDAFFDEEMPEDQSDLSSAEPSPSDPEAETGPEGQPSEPGDPAEADPASPAGAVDGGARAEDKELENQQVQQWLRRIPDDPGGLLRRKFRYQYEQSDVAGEREGRLKW